MNNRHYYENIIIVKLHGRTEDFHGFFTAFRIIMSKLKMCTVPVRLASHEVFIKELQS